MLETYAADQMVRAREIAISVPMFESPALQGLQRFLPAAMPEKRQGFSAW